MLPASRQERFVTLHDGQKYLRFEIYQGEGYFASENLYLGELEVRVPPGPAGRHSALVTFTYDIDGILHVAAKSSGGDCRDKLILNPNLHLTPGELDQAMARLQQLQLAAHDSQRDQALLDRALALYERCRGRNRDLCGELIGFWRQVLEQGSRSSREQNYTEVKSRLDWLEEQMNQDPLEDFWRDTEE